MPVTQKILLAALSIVSILLLAGFFFVFFTQNETEPVELTAGESVAAGLAEPGNGSTPEPEEAEPELRVYIAGAVQQPGVYALQPGERLVDALDAAGGPTSGADLEAVNLAVRVQDGKYYFIPAKAPEPNGESPAGLQAEEPSTAQVPSAAADPITGQLITSQGAVSEPSSKAGELVNLNTATEAELEKLPGIGPARAAAIVHYREQNGPFTAIEEITAISGIGQGILDNLQGLITVEESP